MQKVLKSLLYCALTTAQGSESYLQELIKQSWVPKLKPPYSSTRVCASKKSTELLGYRVCWTALSPTNTLSNFTVISCAPLSAFLIYIMSPQRNRKLQKSVTMN